LIPKTFIVHLVLAAAAATGLPVAAWADAPAPIVVSGTVGDDASKAALLARLRVVYGAERIVDQLVVGHVSTPPDWDVHLAKLIGPNLKLISRGQLQVDGTSVSLRGDVASEAQRTQIAGDIALALDPA
jgi:OOP family OmpA-OmpF porin